MSIIFRGAGGDDDNGGAGGGLGDDTSRRLLSLGVDSPSTTYGL